MPPSRGWQLRSIVGAAIPRQRPLNGIRVSHRLYSTQFTARRPTHPPRSWQSSRLAIPPTSLFRRNQSTAAAPSPAITPLEGESSSGLVESLGDLTSAPDYSQIPEKIGYLKELGLDFGWGPTSLVQWMLEHVHIYTATPWWASIVITTVIIRTAMFPLVMRQSNEMAKMSAMKPILDEIKAKQAQSGASGNPQQAVQARLEMQQHLKAADISLSRMWIPMLLQFPVGFGAFKLTRAAANLPVPAWEHGGLAWITDLTVPDPYYIIPLAMVAIMHMLMRFGGEAGANEPSAMMKPIMLYVLPGSIALFAVWQPAALQLTLFATLLLGTVQSFLLRNARFRQWAGLNPIIKSSTATQMARQRQLEALSRLNMAHAYQAPTMRPAFTEQKKGVWHNVKSQWEEAKQDTMKRIAGARGEAPPKAGDRPKSFLKRAEAYEKRRQKEIEADKEFRKLR